MPTPRRREILTRMAAQSLIPGRWRPALLRAAGISIDPSAIVRSGVRITGEGRLAIGAGCFINHDCLIDCAGDVHIGRNVSLGDRVLLLTSGHDYSDPHLRAGPRRLRPIVVDDGAWLGANTTVLGGAHVGPGAVTAAGAVVTEDVPGHTLWAGVPARQIGLLPS